LIFSVGFIFVFIYTILTLSFESKLLQLMSFNDFVDPCPSGDFAFA